MPHLLQSHTAGFRVSKTVTCIYKHSNKIYTFSCRSPRTRQTNPDKSLGIIHLSVNSKVGAWTRVNCVPYLHYPEVLTAHKAWWSLQNKLCRTRASRLILIMACTGSVVSSIQAHSYVVTVQTMSVVQPTVHCTHTAQSSTGRKKGETWAA